MKWNWSWPFCMQPSHHIRNMITDMKTHYVAVWWNSFNKCSARKPLRPQNTDYQMLHQLFFRMSPVWTRGSPFRLRFMTCFLMAAVLLAASWKNTLMLTRVTLIELALKHINTFSFLGLKKNAPKCVYVAGVGVCRHILYRFFYFHFDKNGCNRVAVMPLTILSYDIFLFGH